MRAETQTGRTRSALLLHPSVANLYREKVTGLCHALEGNERSLAGAREAIRGLIEEVSLEPAGDQLRIILKGNLAGCCGWPKKTKGRRRPTTSWTKYCWLRGARNQQYLEFARTAA
jgi:hypothetical protein